MTEPFLDPRHISSVFESVGRGARTCNVRTEKYTELRRVSAHEFVHTVG